MILPIDCVVALKIDLGLVEERQIFSLLSSEVERWYCFVECFEMMESLRPGTSQTLSS